jgi:exo-beta-1,3-glucanase (GH17 family)
MTADVLLARQTRMFLKMLTLVVTVLSLWACVLESQVPATPIKVEIVETDVGYQLLRGGEPYVIRGAGMGDNDIENFAAHGGNSIRNWTTSNDPVDIETLLDDAFKNGVTVGLGLTMQAERWGFDYDDEEAVARQLEFFRTEVLKYRDHPALLFWIIGNELNHNYTNSKVYDAVDDVAEMIHELDPNHPTTTTIAGFSEKVLRDIETRAPSLDFVSFQLYGGLFNLPVEIKQLSFTGPFMVTEWGAIGFWEVDETSWGAPIEATSTEKADVFMRGQREVLDSLEGQLIGSYAFLWGQKQERTPTWFGMFTERGEQTEVVDVMRFLWTGSWPDNLSPQVRSLRIDGQDVRSNVMVNSGAQFEAVADIVDPEGESLSYRWELKPESQATQEGGDFEVRITSLEGRIKDASAASTWVTAPEPGSYRLFVYATDGNGRAAHANIPFKVIAGTSNLIANEVMAVAYSGYREGQHPDRGNGAVNPSNAEILEDLGLLLDHDFKLIRLYDSGENTRSTLELIREHELPIKVLLGVWLQAEVSNHLGCPWLDEPISEEDLGANTVRNAEEIERGIRLAQEFRDIVVAVNVGNEALVDWNDHMVPLDKVIAYVKLVKATIEQPVTVADNYAWWIRDGAPLAEEVDFVGVHTYPVWEGKSIDDGLSYTIENIDGVRAALPGKPIAILEAGWATVASEFGDTANEAAQVRYFREMAEWAREEGITVFFFEAFDEPWKGDVNNPMGAEKHWGLFNVDRTPKKVLVGNEN